jgi:hypothetical protein
MNNHNKFILKPITVVLNEVVISCTGIGCGIETYPLFDYITQSVFLKMTGFQEQKMKCICWELASNDFNYRRLLLSNEDKLGECSSYKDKCNIYKRLVEQISNSDSDFNVTKIKKNEIRNRTAVKIKEIFSNTNLLIWGQGAFNNYEGIWKNIDNKHFANENNNLFPEIKNGISLKHIYVNHLYEHRNRIAHNTHSYRQNLPTLKTLINKNHIYENYFLWFALLILIDDVFVELYKKYLRVIEDN